jgi:hypothetical protein
MSEHEQEPEKPMLHNPRIAGDARLDALLTSTMIRPEAVARARQLLATPSWCRAEEVASRLVDCLVDHRLP